MRSLLPVLAALSLAACGGYGEATSTPAPEPEYQEREAGADYVCDASELQDSVGQTATAESGTKLLEQSGARTLRWGAPNSAWTMDYRQDRVNVRYDEARTITEITCG